MTAWLTRIRLDTRHRTVLDDLRDVVALHRRIMSLVPDRYDERPRSAAGVLYRVEDDNASPSLLMQTLVRPDPSRLPAHYGHVQSKNLSPLLDMLDRGLAVNYRLTGNTSKRLGRKPARGRPGQVVALRGADAEDWWARRAPGCGLALRTVHMRQMEDLCGVRNGEAVRHAAARFEGIAVVEDPDSLRSAVLAGIGRGKSYGCGLLSIAPFGGHS